MWWADLILMAVIVLCFRDLSRLRDRIWALELVAARSELDAEQKGDDGERRWIQAGEVPSGEMPECKSCHSIMVATGKVRTELEGWALIEPDESVFGIGSVLRDTKRRAINRVANPFGEDPDADWRRAQDEGYSVSRVRVVVEVED